MTGRVCGILMGAMLLGFVTVGAAGGESIAAAQNELAAFFAELKAMKDTQQFRNLGFASKNQAAAHWKTRVEEARGRLEADPDLPVEVKIVPGSLLMLGLSWVESKGEPNDDTEWHLEIIQNGLNYKPGD